MNKKITIFIVSILCILIITTGASYAYFTATITGNTTATTSTINTGTMAITYTDGSDVSATNWIPGDSLTKTFSVKSTGNVPTKYTIYLSELINTFGDPTDLVYTLTSSNGGINVVETQLPILDSVVVAIHLMLGPIPMAVVRYIMSIVALPIVG
jgi:type 1 fimbria pilin